MHTICGVLVAAVAAAAAAAAPPLPAIIVRASMGCSPGTRILETQDACDPPRSIAISSGAIAPLGGAEPHTLVRSAARAACCALYC